MEQKMEQKMDDIVVFEILRMIMASNVSPKERVKFFIRRFPAFLKQSLHNVEQSVVGDFERVLGVVRENIDLFKQSIVQISLDWYSLAVADRVELCFNDMIHQYKIPLPPQGKYVTQEFVPNQAFNTVLTDITKYCLYLEVRLDTTRLNYELASASVTGVSPSVTMSDIYAVHELLKLVITDRHPRLVANGPTFNVVCRIIRVEKVPVVSHQLLRADIAIIVMVLIDCMVRIDLVEDHPTRSLEYRRLDNPHAEEPLVELFGIINQPAAPGDEWNRFHNYAKLPSIYFKLFMDGVKKGTFSLDKFMVEPVCQVVKTLRHYRDPGLLDFFRDCSQIAMQILLPTQRYSEAFQLIMILAVRLLFSIVANKSDSLDLQLGVELTSLLTSVAGLFPGPENEGHRACAAAACEEPELWLNPLCDPLVLKPDPFAKVDEHRHGLVALMTGAARTAVILPEDAPGAAASAALAAGSSAALEPGAADSGAASAQARVLEPGSSAQESTLGTLRK